jgi:hypothetical protein
MDSGPLPDGFVPNADAGPPAPCTGDGECPGSYCNPGSRVCCVRAIPSYEICGDRIDQDCNRMDDSCGDTDGDGIMACRPGESPVGGGCDCDDRRTDVRPPFGAGVPGAPEVCDGVDNDCNGRIDESAMCCAGCASLGTARDRADLCTEAGECDCSTEPGIGPCASGLTCCTSGCVDVTTDFDNCGFCNAQCTVSADHCEARECRCGAGPVCDLDTACVGGSC